MSWGRETLALPSWRVFLEEDDSHLPSVTANVLLGLQG
jgi:hypothetical protein